MKKKLLLLTLPALLVLSGCGNRPVEKQEVLPAASMSEDTLAHEEGAEQLVRTAPYRTAMTSDFVKVGYQIQYSDNGEDPDTISIRFVAALKGNVTHAYWHRGIAQPDSAEGANVGNNVWKYKFNDNTEHESTVFYTALNNGGVRVAAGEPGDYADYSCFAIYTLMNIPYETYKDSYLAAYVTLQGDNEINSQGIAVKIERNGTASKNRFYFDADTTGHFLQGTIGGELRDGSDNSTHSLVRATELASGAHSAKYTGLALETTDSFGSFYYAAGTNFQFFGYNTFVKNTAYPVFEAASLGEYNKPKFDDTFTLYVSRDYFNKIYCSATTTVSVNFSTNYGAGQNNALFIVGDMTNWGYSESYRLNWSDGDNWSRTISVPIGARLKFVVSNWDCSGSWSRWESGEGHIITSSTTSVGGVLTWE